jgi:hypothetical protein
VRTSAVSFDLPCDAEKEGVTDLTAQIMSSLTSTTGTNASKVGNSATK